MTNPKNALPLIIAVFLAGAGQAPAASTVGDLDLLAKGTVPPNVMLVFDNSGSMRSALDGSTRLDIAGGAALALIENLYPDDGAGGYTATVRLGLTVFDWDDTKSGGEVAVDIADGNKQDLIDGINATVAKTKIIGEQAKGTFLAETLVDVGRYFAGQHGFGTYPAVTNTSPIDLECRENFVVFMTDGETNEDLNDHYGAIDATTTAWSNFVDTIGNADGDANECSLDAPATCIDDPHGGRDDGDTYSSATGTDWFDDVAYYLAHTDFVPDATLPEFQNVRTYTIGFTNSHVLLQETAANGLGAFYNANDSAALATSLQEAFNSIFDEVQASFTSSVVPGAALGLGNAFYNTYFKSSDDPIWEGHLEALRITQTGVIMDSQPAVAVDAVTGDLVDGRVPFWDAAVPLKTNTNRTIYTTIGGSQEDFDNVLVTSTLLDVDTPAYGNYPNSASSGVDTVSELVDAVIAYIRGKDGFDEDNDADATEMRGTVLGDIFHSSLRAIAAPTRLNIIEAGFQAFYNQYRGRDRVVYAGANDGMLHAFDAGQFMTGDDASTLELEQTYYTPGFGTELFGYVPGMLLDRMKLVPQNSPRSEFFVDGPIAVADAWVNDGTGTDIVKVKEEWTTVMITGFREGGPGYLALDITDPDAGAGDDHGPYPVLMWEFDDADLGESWSEAVITKVKMRHPTVGTGDKCLPTDGDGDCREQWVAIFGGGYLASGDPNRPASYIDDPTDAAWDDASKAIYMVNIEDGSVLAKVEFDASTNPNMKYSIPSSPAVLDLDFDGFADVVYVGDLGGQIWKWDIHAVGEDTDADPLVDNWPHGRFFATAPVTLSDGTTPHHRSFFFPPAATFSRGELVLAFGSGERHNLSNSGDTDVSVTDENRFYVVEDATPIGVGAFPATRTDASLTDVTALDTDTNLSDGGYYFTLSEGEKFVTEVTVFAGYVIVGSYTPVPNADLCSTAAGQSFLHVFNVATGRGFFEDVSDPPSEDRRAYIGGGFPTSPKVTVANDPNDDTIIITTSEGPRVISVDAPPRDDLKGSIIYWKQQM
jgi:type IV pilus assembly protein PilY1